MSKHRDALVSRERRQFLAGATGLAVAASAPAILHSRSAHAADKRMTLVSWGGAYRQAVEEALVKPFSKAEGVQVTIVDTPDLAKLRAQVSTNNVQWDVFDAPNALGVAGANAGLWEPLDLSLFDRSDLVIDIKNNLLPWYVFVGGIAWDPKKYPEGKHPRNFREYFDAKAFPGRRTFRNRPSETLEAALLADGVSPKHLYPLDVDRAFKVLDRIKPHVVKWIDQTPQTLSLLQTGETDFSYTYASRVKPAKASGQSVDFSFDQTINGFEYLAVVKNAPNKANAMKFLAFAARPDRQAAFMELLGNTPSSKKALGLMSAESRKWIPDLQAPNSVLMDDAWWTTHFDDITRRFKEWALS
ncbi:ABC transporter substrate-binding protein [Chitinasiproducens palmae]|uniref:Putative spermidine/putrescine transport system substrate-binding protein n=1 Tax=Chitinasiproducens palmae TaxID=1770053 RepID=A0A1H2PPT4_9BURK|nr:ABC transporter substrate-binding protein [Chitinasiproducens palmae]SDV48757.1 putative spermidine/putrescine transport system substrate-binding protein [Chitinasiproducens palmae]